MHRHLLAPAALLVTLTACQDTEVPASSLPKQPESFRIELSASSCFGSCPTYTAVIDQDGHVSFLGGTCVTKPGVFEHEVTAADARAIYDALRATKYGSLNDQVSGKQAAWL